MTFPKFASNEGVIDAAPTVTDVVYFPADCVNPPECNPKAGVAKGVDLRKQGSGNLGATNVFRVLGWKTGLLVFLADALKGGLPVLLLPMRISSGVENPMVWAIACGVAAIIGHVRPIFLGLKRGGKGVATAAGVIPHPTTLRP